jgi:hypothetical protein
MVRNRSPVASRAPRCRRRKRWAEKYLSHGRRPRGRAAQRLGARPSWPGQRPVAARRQDAPREGQGHQDMPLSLAEAVARANQAVNTGRHQQELHVPAQPRQRPGHGRAAFPAGRARHRRGAPSGCRPYGCRGAGGGLSAGWPCGAMGGHAGPRWCPCRLPDRNGCGHVATAWSYAGASHGTAASRRSGFPREPPSRQVDAIGSDRLGVPDYGEIGRPRRRRRRMAKTGLGGGMVPWRAAARSRTRGRCHELGSAGSLISRPP